METPSNTKKILDGKYAFKAMDYDTYLKTVAGLLSENKVTGPIQSEALVEYSRLNMHRMHRIKKTMQVLPEVKSILESITLPQTWVVLTEGWCGDAAQILPVLNGLSQLNGNIKLVLLLRDENLDLMDQYLTNGTSKSIPKLIVYDSSTREELFNWGPRPAVVQEKLWNMMQEGMPYETIKEEVHRWYAKDRTNSTQNEISNLVREHSKPDPIT